MSKEIIIKLFRFNELSSDIQEKVLNSALKPTSLYEITKDNVGKFIKKELERNGLPVTDVRWTPGDQGGLAFYGAISLKHLSSVHIPQNLKGRDYFFEHTSFRIIRRPDANQDGPSSMMIDVHTSIDYRLNEDLQKETDRVINKLKEDIQKEVQTLAQKIFINAQNVMREESNPRKLSACLKERSDWYYSDGALHDEIRD